MSTQSKKHGKGLLGHLLRACIWQSFPDGGSEYKYPNSGLQSRDEVVTLHFWQMTGVSNAHNRAQSSIT